MAQVLRPLKALFNPQDYPDLLVGLASADDAAVYQLDDERAIITTVDFFPPVVDNPYDYGAISAANALSDVYAMGGEPLFAINLLAVPDDLDKGVVSQILLGGAEKMAEAGGVIAGGHSVNDKEPKYGLAVTGIIHPDQIITKGGGQPGDVLVLTKPLGAGLVTTALKQGISAQTDVEMAVRSMKRLNKRASRSAIDAGTHAMTDITGFGLLGHAHEMAHLGEVKFQFETQKLPWLPGASDYAKQGALPGGTWRNQEYFAPWVTFGDGVPAILQDMLWTPETSGGLLIAISPDKVDAYCRQTPTAVQIGKVMAGNGEIELV